jgi:hypothetical protein
MKGRGLGTQGWERARNVAQAVTSAGFSAPLRIVLAVFAVIAALGCSSKSGSTPRTFFPETNEVSGWSKVGEMRTFEASRLWEYIDGDADRYVQAGVEKTLTADYRYGGRIEAVVDIHVMRTPDGPRKIYEAESRAGSQPIQLGDAARLSKGSLTFCKGRYFTRLVAYQEAPEVGDALVALGRAIERKLSKAETRD